MYIKRQGDVIWVTGDKKERQIECRNRGGERESVRLSGARRRWLPIGEEKEKSFG